MKPLHTALRAIAALKFSGKSIFVIVATTFFATNPSVQWANVVDAVAASPVQVSLATAQQKLGANYLPFVPNAGQWDARAAFGAKTFAGTLFVTRQGELIYSLPGKPVDANLDARRVLGADLGALDRTAATPRGDRGASPTTETITPRGSSTHRSAGWVLTETLVDARGQPRVARRTDGLDPTPARVSFHTIDAVAAHKNGLNAYERVNLGEMYPGVNVVLRAAQTKVGNNVEKIFTVAPHQDPTQIQIKFSGATKLEIGKQGELIAHTGNGPVAFTAPIAFQTDERGERVSVEVAYQLVGADLDALVAIASDAAQATASRNLQADTYTFTLGAYDATRPLVIDPLLASTYLGGGSDDQINAMTIHPHSGEVYVAGRTQSTGFPQTSGGGQASATGQSCFVSRYSADLSRLIQSTYLGDGSVSCLALAIHPASGAVYVAGELSGTSSLPSGSLTNAIQPTHASQGNGLARDGFVALLSADLKTLTQATYYGGVSNNEGIAAIAVHPLTGQIHIAGNTDSPALPGTVVGTQTTYGGSFADAFTARLPASLTGAANVRYTYIGGSGVDVAKALAIDPRSGDVYVAGYTQGGLPAAMLGGAAQMNHMGSDDAFVARLKSDLSAVVRATYLGGTGFDRAESVAVSPITGEVLVAGSTSSNPFPQTNGGAQPAYGGSSYDGFVTRLAPDLKTIGQSTYLGGAGWDCVERCTVAIHPQSGEVFFAGDSDGALPTSIVPNTAIQATAGGNSDALIVRLNATLTAARGGTYLGGTGFDIPRAIAIEPAGGGVVVAGRTSSTDFPTANAQQGASGGVNGDAFVSRFSTDLTAVNRQINPVSFVHQSNVPAGSVRSSNEVQLTITPNPGNNQQSLYLSGAGTEYCITNTAGCCATPQPLTCAGYVSGWVNQSFWDFVSGDRIAIRHTQGAAGTTETKLIVGGQAYPFRTSTGNANIACNLDMNGDNVLSATVEGLILVRAMLGLNADAIVAGTGVTAAFWDFYIRDHLNTQCSTRFPFLPSLFQ